MPSNENVFAGQNGYPIFFPKSFDFCLTCYGDGGIIFLAMRRYLSWIEGLTTNQNVTGSNPVRRTS